jgi:hypothetical protein
MGGKSKKSIRMKMKTLVNLITLTELVMQQIFTNKEKGEIIFDIG